MLVRLTLILSPALLRPSLSGRRVDPAKYWWDTCAGTSMIAAIFVLLSVLTFVGVASWQNREEFVGGSPNKFLTVGVLGAVLLLIMVIAHP